MRDQFGGAIFEGILAAAQATGRGSAFGTDYVPYIPVYDPLNPANIMRLDLEENYETGDEPAHKKCCGGTSPTCKGCDNCGSRTPSSP